jgi:hypothetical protein
MAQTTVSLYPKYMMGEALGTGSGPVQVSYVTVGEVNVVSEPGIAVEIIPTIEVAQVVVLPVEVVETVGIEVSVCDGDD